MESILTILGTALVHALIAFGTFRARLAAVEEKVKGAHERIDDHLQNHIEGLA